MEKIDYLDALRKLQFHLVEHKQSLPKEILPKPLPAVATLPIMVIMLREALAYRIIDLSQEACNCYENESIVPGIVLTRATFETVAILFVLNKKIKIGIEEKDLKDLDDIINKMILGGKDEDLLYRGVTTKLTFAKADPNGASILDGLIKNGILEEVSLTEVRLKGNEVESISRPQEIKGNNFDEIWAKLYCQVGGYNVFTAIEHMNKWAPIFTKYYTKLSDFAHPNWSGSVGSYTWFDKEKCICGFGRNIHGINFPLALGATSLITSLEIFEEIYNEISGNIVAFSKMIDADLKIPQANKIKLRIKNAKLLNQIDGENLEIQ